MQVSLRDLVRKKIACVSEEFSKVELVPACLSAGSSKSFSPAGLSILKMEI